MGFQECLANNAIRGYSGDRHRFLGSEFLMLTVLFKDYPCGFHLDFDTINKDVAVLFGVSIISENGLFDDHPRDTLDLRVVTCDSKNILHIELTKSLIDC